MGRQLYSNFLTMAPTSTHQRQGVDSVVTITAPTQATMIVIQAEVSAVRITLDGVTNPTATLGFRFTETDGERRIDVYPGFVIKAIGEAAGAFVNYQFFRGFEWNAPLA